MASAMSGSRRRAFEHPRPPSLIVARMPQLALLAFVLVNLNQPVKAENKPGPHGDAGEYAWVSMFIASCDDLPDQRTEVHGIVKVLGDIICPENRVRNTIHVYFTMILVGLFSVGVYEITDVPIAVWCF